MIPLFTAKDIADPRTPINPTKKQAAVPFFLRLKPIYWLLYFKNNSDDGTPFKTQKILVNYMLIFCVIP